MTAREAKMTQLTTMASSVAKKVFQNEIRSRGGVVGALLCEARRSGFGERTAAQGDVPLLVRSEKLVFVGDVEMLRGDGSIMHGCAHGPLSRSVFAAVIV